MVNQTGLSPQAEVVLSLFRDVEAAEARIDPKGTDFMYQAKRLIEGDLDLADREALKLTGDERTVLSAKGSYLEARIRYRLLGNTLSSEGKDELRKAARCAESANRQFPTAACQLLLGHIYTELKEHEKARQAFQAAASTDEGEASIEAKKALMRFEQGRKKADEEMSTDKAMAIGGMVFGGIICVVALWTNAMLLPIGLIILAIGGFNYLKAMIVKR